MSTRIVVQVQMTDDLDNTSEAAETVLFGWKGTWYEIDLSAVHLADLTDSLEQYLRAARRADAVRAPANTVFHQGGHTEARRFNAAARAWGRERGYDEHKLQPGVALPRKLREEFTSYLIAQEKSGKPS